MPKTWTDWEPVETMDVLPAGVYDLRLNELLTGAYLTEIRSMVSTPTVAELDQVLSRNFDGGGVYVAAAKRLTTAERLNVVTLSIMDYDVLMAMCQELADTRTGFRKRITLETLFEIAGRAGRVR